VRQVDELLALIARKRAQTLQLGFVLGVLGFLTKMRWSLAVMGTKDDRGEHTSARTRRKERCGGAVRSTNLAKASPTEHGLGNHGGTFSRMTITSGEQIARKTHTKARGGTGNLIANDGKLGVEVDADVSGHLRHNLGMVLGEDGHVLSYRGRER